MLLLPSLPIQIALLAGRLAAATDSVTPDAVYRLHKFAQPIGEERLEIVRSGSTTTRRSAFLFTDRNTPVKLSATLTLGPDQSPIHYEIAGRTSRSSGIDAAVDIDGRHASLRMDSTVRSTQVSKIAFPIIGYAPVAMQEALVQYWIRNARPDTLETLPVGRVLISERGRDTIKVADRSLALTRYYVRGLIWGGETLWLDDSARIVAAVSTDAEFDHFEAVRLPYESALTQFIDLAARDQMAALSELARGTQQESAKLLALVGGRIVDGTGGQPVEDGVVLVRDGKISAAGPRGQVQIPKDAVTIDVRGKTILPGLWDMHAHFEQVEWGSIYLAAGVTTVRDCGNEREFMIAVRDAIRAGRGIGPRLLLAGLIDGSSPSTLGVQRADTPEQGIQWVQAYQKAGFDQIKTYSSVTLPVLRAIATEAHRVGLTVTGHIARGIDPFEAIAAGQDQINHIVFVRQMMFPKGTPLGRNDPVPPLDLQSPEAKRTIEFLKAHHTVIDPTIALYEQRAVREGTYAEHEPGVAKLPAELSTVFAHTGSADSALARTQATFAQYLTIIGALHRAGIPVVAGTDQAVPGHSIHREMELYVKAGFTPIEAIQAATSVPAKVMGLDRESGTIAVGKIADLIVVDGDPLKDISDTRKVRLTIARGRMYKPDLLWPSVGFRP